MGIKQNEARRRAERQNRARLEQGVPLFCADGQRTIDQDTEWEGYWIDSQGERQNCGHLVHQSQEAAQACAMRRWQRQSKKEGN
jgi:hypothetical protein